MTLPDGLRGDVGQFRNPELRLIWDAIQGLAGGLRQGLIDDLWQRIPAYVSESGFVAAAGAGTVITAPPEYGTLEIIRSVVAVVPAGSSGLIQLGALSLPASAGLTTIAGVTLPLGPSDTRALTISGGNGGPALLWLTGEQAPTFGVMGP